MATARRSSKAANEARTQVLQELKDDHKRVKKAYKDFQKLDPEEQRDECEALVQQVLQELTLHAELEEELLYPAAREVVREESLIDEAEVEHESMKILIEQLQGMDPDDEKYAARFTVLCEYTLHHVKEEEGEMFPELDRARLDWESIAAEMTERRQALMGDDAEGEDGALQAGPLEGGQSDDADGGMRR
jgi:hemerythrin superfamily protein